MNTEAAMELQMRLAKEALAMLVIHPTFDVQLYRESIMEIGEARELPADATLEALALIEHERLAIQKAGEGGVVQHILPEEELPMHATGTETLDKNAILNGGSYLEGATAKERNKQIGGHKA